jgi:hypothetical protein
MRAVSSQDVSPVFIDSVFIRGHIFITSLTFGSFFFHTYVNHFSPVHGVLGLLYNNIRGAKSNNLHKYEFLAAESPLCKHI